MMIPSEVVAVLAEIFEFGEKERGHPPGGWERIPIDTHIIRAIAHIGHYLADTNPEEDNLAHAMWRLCMAVTLRRRKMNDIIDLNPESIDPTR